MSLELNHKQAVNRERDLVEEIQRLRDKTDKTPDDFAALNTAATEFRAVNSHRLALEHDALVTEVVTASKRGQTEAGSSQAVDEVLLTEAPTTVRSTTPAAAGAPASGSTRSRYRDPWNLGEVRTFSRDPEAVTSELRSRALDAVERMPHASDAVRDASTQIIEEHGADSDSRLSKLALMTTSPEYVRGFVKLMRANGQMGVLSRDEADAITRAMSLTDSAGGYLVPFHLDPTVIITAAGSRNRIRQISRVVQTQSDSWNGVSTAGVTGSWDAEAAEVSDDAPTFAQPTIPVYKGAIFVPISIEAAQDEQNVASEVGRMIAFEKDRMEAVAHAVGSGSGEPTGIVTALTGGSSVVASATADTFAIGDVFALDSALPARFADNATWLAHRAVYNLARRFDTNGGAGLWTQLGNGLPPELLGRPAATAEAMDGTITALADNLIAIFGDFSNFVIVDRIGTTIEYIPHLFGANRRPTGQRGWYAYFRTGSDSVNDAAFRLLNVT